MLSLSNMCRMRNKHLKQLKGKEGTAKKMLVGRKKIKFKPSATSIAQEQETEPLLYTALEPQCRTWERKKGEGRCQHQQGEQQWQSCSTCVGSQARARADLGNLHSNISSYSHTSCCQFLNGGHLLSPQSFVWVAPYTHLLASLPLLHPKCLMSQCLYKRSPSRAASPCCTSQWWDS